MQGAGSVFFPPKSVAGSFFCLKNVIPAGMALLDAGTALLAE